MVFIRNKFSPPNNKNIIIIEMSFLPEYDYIKGMSMNELLGNNKKIPEYNKKIPEYTGRLATGRSQQQIDKDYQTLLKKQGDQQMKEKIRQANKTIIKKNVDLENSNDDFVKKFKKTFNDESTKITAFLILNKIWDNLTDKIVDKIYWMSGKSENYSKLYNYIDDLHEKLPFYRVFGVIDGEHIINGISLDNYFERLKTMWNLLEIEDFTRISGFETAKNLQEGFRHLIRSKKKKELLKQIDRFWNKWYITRITFGGFSMDEDESESTEDESESTEDESESTEDEELEYMLKTCEPEQFKIYQGSSLGIKEILDNNVITPHLLGVFINGDLGIKECKKLANVHSRRKLFNKIN